MKTKNTNTTVATPEFDETMVTEVAEVKEAPAKPKAPKLTKINYKGTDDHLQDCLVERGIPVPTTDAGYFSRSAGTKSLQAWETADQKINGERVRVIFHRSMNPSAGTFVFASINGENFQAPFEKEVEVKKYFLTECIDRALTKTTRTVVRENGVRENIEDVVPTYPYTIVGAVE